MRSVRFVMFVALAFAAGTATVFAQPRPSVPGVSTTTSSNPDAVIDDINTGFEAMAKTFDLASGVSLKSNEYLVAALINKDKAGELKKKRQELEKIENDDERRAALTELASDPAIQKELTAAGKKVKELSDEQKKFVNKAHGLNLLAGLTFAKFVPDSALVAKGFATLGANMTNASFVKAMEKKGGSKYFNEEVKPAVDQLNSNKKTFDKSAGTNLKLLKNLNKKFKLGEVEAADPKEADESSDF